MSEEDKLALFTAEKARQGDPVSDPMSPAHATEYAAFCYTIDYVGAK